MRRVSAFAALLLCAAALLLAGCSSATDGGTPANQIEIGPPNPTVALAETLQLTATVRDDDGHPIAGAVVFWSSSAPQIAEVDQDGLVTPRQIGEADIAASSEGRSGVVRVRVLRKRAARVTLAPASSSATVGDTVPMQVVVEAVDGERLTDRTVSFASTAPTVADVVGAGLAVARAPGTASIVARVEEVADTSRLTVAQATVASLDISPQAPSLVVGETVTLRVTAFDAKGRALSGRAITFTSSRSDVATVSSSGVVTGRAEGQATIAATAEGVREQVIVRVSPVPLSQVTLAPSTFSLRVGESRTITATIRNASGQVVTGRPIAWSSTAPLVARVDQSGAVTGLLPGSAVITAKVDGLEASAGVTVALVPVRSVTVTPSSATLVVGERRALTAAATDDNGNPATGRAVSWRSSNSDVAAVSSTGEVIATGAGTAAITATIESVEGTASVTVDAPAVASVTVSPASASLEVGQTRQLSATVRDVRGDVVTGRTVTWSSSSSAVATVSSTGLVTAAGPGEASIAATVDGVAGSSAITVAAAAIREVAVSPSTAELEIGDTRQLSVTVTNTDGQTVSNPSVTWRSSSDGVATVSTSGLVTATGAGTATITATVGGVSGTALIEVADDEGPLPAGEPDALRLVSGDLQTGRRNRTLPAPVVVLVVDANGTPVPGVRVAWTANMGGEWDPAQSTTDATGRTSSQWRLGNPLGTQNGQATVTSKESVTVAFTAIAIP